MIIAEYNVFPSKFRQCDLELRHNHCITITLPFQHTTSMTCVFVFMLRFHVVYCKWQRRHVWPGKYDETLLVMLDLYTIYIYVVRPFYSRNMRTFGSDKNNRKWWIDKQWIKNALYLLVIWHASASYDVPRGKPSRPTAKILSVTHDLGLCTVP